MLIAETVDYRRRKKKIGGKRVILGVKIRVRIGREVIMGG